MTNSSRLNMVRALAFTVSVLALAATAGSQERPPIVDQMAKTYGLDSWGKIEKIRYTFNVDSAAFKVARTWEWEPKTDQISYEGKDKDGKPVNVTYQRSQLDSQPDAVKNETDPAFVNDQYWLLLPFHVVWDSGGAKVTDGGMKKLPVGDGSAEQVNVEYGSGGYAPGDTWELYVGADRRIEALVYHGGGPGTQKRPNLLIVTWAGHKKAGPLLIATEHQGTADGKPLRLFFSDVAVKLTGSDSWVKAQ
jgi:hypothetical protein